jgi:hypothetical protein
VAERLGEERDFTARYLELLDDRRGELAGPRISSLLTAKEFKAKKKRLLGF